MFTNTQANTQTIWKFLWEILKPYKWWCVLMLQAPILTAFYMFLNNYALKLLIDAFSIESSVGYSHLIFPIILFISAEMGLDISWRLSNFAEWNSEPFARRTVLLKAYDYIQYHSYRFFQNMHSGTIISKLKGILDGFDYVLKLHHSMIRNFSIVIVSIFVLLLINVPVFLFMLVWCIVLLVIMYPMSLKFNKLSNEFAESKHQIIGLLSDNITNIFSLFYFAKRKSELKRADEFISNDCVPKQLKLGKYDFKFCLVGSLLYWIMLITVFFFMIYLRVNSSISTGDFIFVMLTTIQIGFHLWNFIFSMCDFIKKMGDFKSSFSILATPHEQLDSPSAKDIGISKGNIEFKNLSFSYVKDKPVFQGLNLSIRSGEKIGIVGHSGAGKSTLVSLLLKNFKPTSGEINVDDRNIEDMTSDSLRSQISFIPQDIMLFHRSIAENIGYAKENASLQEIKEAAKMANIDDFIESLPEKYDTLVGERGIKISGGQRQRIAIARAILKNAPIIILDEATSNLDTLTEQPIQQSINLMLEKSKATVVAIAHRLSTIRHMDRIVVMEDGKILEQGNFNELIKMENGYFKKLWESQINGMIL